MTRSAVWSFSDPLEYDAAIRAADVNTLSVQGREFRASLSRVNLGTVWMQRFQETSQRVMRVASHASRSIILFRTPGGAGVLRHRGQDVDDDTVMFFGAGAIDDQSSSGQVGFGTMSLTPDDLSRFGGLLAERDLIAPRDTIGLRPRPAALARLRFLHGAAADLARMKPEILDHREVARALEEAFILAMVRCGAGAETLIEWPRGPIHARLMRRLEELLAQNAGRPVYLAELCRSLSVSERTLERCCQEMLGMGPTRYLRLRRLHLARRSLVEADASKTTVAEVALAHGFWQLGRFAVRYREAFGEPPSATLRRPRRNLSAAVNALFQ
jgi:AraC-like DNA-binding protein